MKCSPFVLSCCLLQLFAGLSYAGSLDDWETHTPRAEISPDFSIEKTGGHHNQPALVIQSDQRPGLHGCWTKTFPITGGKHYHFTAFRKTDNVKSPRRTGLAKIMWLDDQGRMVENDRGSVTNVYRSGIARAEADHPQDQTTDSSGWTEVSGTYIAPGKATQAVVQLHLIWATHATVRWSDISLTETRPLPKRMVRLATIHLQPRSESKTPQGNRELFAPLIEKAAKQKADLIVLPETLTYYGTGKKPEEVAEPMPGPSTEYFGRLAKKHNLYIVAGLYEKAEHLVYNVAILIGPDGKIAGKYRKVTLPTGEVDNGVAPGEEYPVFDTRFGKLGMMICYDGFFPEVARELTNNGAEVIAWPVWGCNPDLAKARAVENHVYLISSTYTDIDKQWMVSAVYSRAGEQLALAKDWGTVVIAEVDLNQKTEWRSLGDFRSKILRHRPEVPVKK